MGGCFPKSTIIYLYPMSSASWRDSLNEDLVHLNHL